MDEFMSIRLAAQHGVVATTDLRNAGVSERTVRTALRRGDLVRVRRGAYVDGPAYRQASADERFRLRVAAVLRTRPDDVASHHAALAVHGLPLFGCDLGRIDTASPVGATTMGAGVIAHPMAGVSVTAVDGVPTVAVADAAVLTTGASGLVAGVVAADAALHRGRCTLDVLREAADRLSTQASSLQLARLVELADAGAESPGESRTRVILRTAGLPVRSQVPIADIRGRVLARVDLLVGNKVIVEFDGELKYTAQTPDALFREKQREDWLRELGYEVVRVVWADLADPARLVARVRAAMARAARRAS